MKHILFLIPLLVLLGSCSKDHTLEEIDSDILVSGELINGKIIIHGETERDYPNSGYQIKYCEKTRGNKIYIKFEKIKVFENGFSVLLPAMCEIELDDLENGEYELTFALNKKKTKGKLIVGSTVQLTVESGGNVKPS